MNSDQWSKTKMDKIHGGNIWKVAKENGLEIGNVIDFSASINPFGLSYKAEMAIKNTISLLGHYPEPGADTMQEELASFHSLKKENILAGNGSCQFIYLIPHIIRPKKVIIIEPAFSEYRNSLLRFNCEIISLVSQEANNFSLDINKLFTLLKDGCDMLYLANPANPTGVLIDKELVLKIANECKRYNTILVADEAFIDFVEDNSLKAEAVLLDNLIVLRSMTKFFSLTGLRLGYMIANKEIIKRFEDIIPPWSVNTMAIAAGIESLKDIDYIKRTREWLRAEMTSLIEGLNALPFLKTYSSEANYLLVKILMDGVKAVDLQKRLLKSGILIRDCSSFLGLDNSFFRIAVKKKEENRLLLNSIGNVFTMEMI